MKRFTPHFVAQRRAVSSLRGRSGRYATHAPHQPIVAGHAAHQSVDESAGAGTPPTLIDQVGVAVGRGVLPGLQKCVVAWVL
jgi:hypothetical protein